MKKIAWKQGSGWKRNWHMPQIVLVLFVCFCLGMYLWDQADGSLVGSIGGEMPTVNMSSAFEQTESQSIAAEETIVTKGAENEQNISSLEMQDAEKDLEPTGESLFAAYRLEREQTKAEELAQLTETAADEQTDPEVKAAAEQSKLALIETYNQEIKAETVIEAKNFGENVVIIGEKQATVIIDGEMDAVNAMQIAEIVDGICGIGYENVIIVNQ